MSTGTDCSKAAMSEYSACVAHFQARLPPALCSVAVVLGLDADCGERKQGTALSNAGWELHVKRAIQETAAASLMVRRLQAVKNSQYDRIMLFCALDWPPALKDFEKVLPFRRRP